MGRLPMPIRLVPNGSLPPYATPVRSAVSCFQVVRSEESDPFLACGPSSLYSQDPSPGPAAPHP